MDGDDGFYEVESICKHRHRTVKGCSDKQLELFVKWKNYPHSDNTCDLTWEPLHGLYDDIRPIAKAYFKASGF